VAEALELSDQPAGVRLVVASPQPVPEDPREPRVIHIYGLTRTTVRRRHRTTGAFSSARTAIKIATDHTA